MAIHPLFTVHTFWPSYVLSNVLDFIEVEWCVYQNVHYFIRSTRSVLNFTAVRYSLHKCSETILCLLLKMAINSTRVTRFPCTEVLTVQKCKYVWRFVNQIKDFSRSKSQGQGQGLDISPWGVLKDKDKNKDWYHWLLLHSSAQPEDVQFSTIQVPR